MTQARDDYEEEVRKQLSPLKDLPARELKALYDDTTDTEFADDDFDDDANEFDEDEFEDDDE